MQTHGPVVVDAFHRKYLLHRQRDPQGTTSGPDLIRAVQLRQNEVREAPHDIQKRDQLVCDIIRLNGTMYEDLRRISQDSTPGAAVDHINRGFALIGSVTDEAFDHLDVMPTLLLGEESSSRISALTAGLAHNIAVASIERGQQIEGAQTASIALEQLRAGQPSGRSRDELAVTIEPLLMVLAG